MARDEVMKGIRPLTPVDAAHLIAETRRGGDPVAIVTVIAGPALGRRLALHHSEDGTTTRTGTLGTTELDELASALGARALEAGEPMTEEHDGVTLYAEAHHPSEELVIVGAGHIAVPLARLGVELGYEVTVLDDREEFATDERFPPVARVLRTDFSDPFAAVRIGSRSHVVLITRAHKYDYDCLHELLRLETMPAYIGMIGSRRRVRATFAALAEGGIAREKLARVSAPVGVEIGAETPAEIAVSIAAELIMLRRGVSEPVLITERERVLERLLPERA